MLWVLFVSLISLEVCADINTLKTMNQPQQKIELIHGDGQVKHAIIWLHGLGATADDFPPIVPELGLHKERPIRFIFPQAPNRPITINGGMVMPGWYDIKGMELADKEDLAGFQASQTLVEQLIEQQIAQGVPSENIILAGFSQGGAVAYYTGIRSQHKLAGLCALSTYLPFVEHTQQQGSEVNHGMAIFATHGTADPVVPVELGKRSVDALTKLGYQSQFKTYPMQHTVILEQILDIGRWISETFDQQPQ